MLKRLPLLGILALWACEPGHDALVSSSAQPIINGSTCGPDSEPSAVAILVEADLVFGFGNMPIRTIACTGTLIAPDVVLTAAHCVDPVALGQGFADVQNAKYYISFTSDLAYLAEADPYGGQALPELPQDAVAAAAWVKHEGFDINAMSSVNGPGDFKDVGLIFLAQPIANVQPEILITKEEAASIKTGAPVQIAGWGAQTPDTGDIFTPPPAGTVGIKNCAASFINEVGPTEIQIGGDVNTSRKCKGDSGGPSYLDLDGVPENRRVVGITSHAYNQQLCQLGGVDTRVDAYLDWIDTQLTAACGDGTRAWCDIPGIILPGATAPNPKPEPEPEPQPQPTDPNKDPSIGPDPRTDDGTTPVAPDPEPLPEDLTSMNAVDEGGCRCVQSADASSALWILFGLFAPLTLRRRPPQT